MFKKSNIKPTASLENEITNAVSMFNSAIAKLQNTVSKANKIKEDKQIEIKNLQAECDDLDTIAKQAEKMSNKILGLLE